MSLPRRRWSPEIHQELVRLLEGPPGVAAFDFDNTCIQGDIGEAMLKHVASPEDVRRYEEGMALEDQQDAYEWLTRCMAGRSVAALRGITQKVLAEARRAGSIAFREEIRDLIWWMQRAGWEVWVVTGSPEPVVAAVAQHYGLSADRVIGMRLAEEEGLLLDRILPPATYRQGKVEALRRAASGPLTFAAGDSMGDVELLEHSLHALVLDRGIDDLRARAEAAGWWIQQAFTA